jgi:rhomboid protease GluP
MYKNVCCPTFNIKQFILWITVFDIFYFIISLLCSDKITGEFLQPDIESLLLLGARYPYQMKQGQIWRFLTSIILHANFMHLLSNIISQLIFGVSLESTVGRTKIILLYVASGVGGCLFSSLISDDISVGASTSIFGLLGGQLGKDLLNHIYMRRQ